MYNLRCYRLLSCEILWSTCRSSPDLSFSGLQRWTDTTTRFTSTTAGWSFSSARSHRRLRTTNRPSSTGNWTRSVTPAPGRHGQNCRHQTDAGSDLSSPPFVIGVWQRVASLCGECGVPHRGSLCGWNYVWAIPGDRGLPTARLQNRNSAYHRCLLAR